MSRVSKDGTFPWARTFSLSCTRQAMRSVADLLGTAPNCWGLREPCMIAALLTLLEISLYKTFPRHIRRAIGRQGRGEFRSLLFSFGSNTTSALFIYLGWYARNMHCLFKSKTAYLIFSQQALRILTIISSSPSDVLEAFMRQFLTSFSMMQSGTAIFTVGL